MGTWSQSLQPVFSVCPHGGLFPFPVSVSITLPRAVVLSDRDRLLFPGSCITGLLVVLAQPVVLFHCQVSVLSASLLQDGLEHCVWSSASTVAFQGCSGPILTPVLSRERYLSTRCFTRFIATATFLCCSL